MALKTGDSVGIYRIDGQIGSGGMATVYKGHHTKLDRAVAVKIMHPNLLTDPSFKQRFDREARIIARLDHPNIVPVYDFNEHEGQPYIVMKQIDGLTLKQMLRTREPSMREVVRILRAVADALDYAHEQGVLHRDIKPSNIIIDASGTPYLTDFGLARLAQSGESTVSSDTVLGTPYYISPEQAQGLKDIGPEADVYSLGVVLYELLAGRVPFQSDTPYSTIHDHIYKTPPPLREYNPDVLPGVEAVVLRALEKDPRRRYASAGALVDALEAAIKSPDRPVVTPREQVRDEPPAVPPRVEVKKPEESFIESFENLGEQIGRWGQEFGERAEEWGRRVEAWGENIGKDGIDRDRSRPRRGATWQKGPSGRWGFYTEEEVNDPDLWDQAERDRVRKFVEKRSEERNGLLIHIAIYVAVNGFILGWGVWPAWFFWGIGLLAHVSDYWNKYGPGRHRMDRAVDEELARERARRGGYKRKNEDLYVEDEDEAARRVRLSGDGELTDSFIDEINRDGEPKRKRRD
jgi:tRNA A-37 threonylcarbamoyl transferase component Bud32